MTEHLHFHFSLSCIGEGNGNPPQCSCLENPRDRGAWWAAVYGVAQSRTRLKRLSSSSFTVGFPGGSVGQESTCQWRYCAWVGKIPWRRKWQPTPVFLPGESYGQRSLADYSPWGRKESDTAEWRNNSFPLRAVPVSLCLFVFPPLYCLISHLFVWNAFLNAETAFSVGENTPHHYHFPFEEIFMCM